MNGTELLSKVRKIEIKAKGLSNNLFAGQYHSAFKGRGMAFAEVRDYQYGDDVRDIDWNVTARFHRPYVKVFEEERELTVMLLVETKAEMAAEIASTLAFSAIQNNDKIGVIFFSDRIEKYIPPKKGRKHILYIIHEMLSFEPESKKTDIGVALEFLGKTQKRRCTAFLMSDFYDRKDFEKPLQICHSRHDVVGIRIYDQLMENMPDVGILRVHDAETGYEQYIDTSYKPLRMAHNKYWREHSERVRQVFQRNSVDYVSVATNGNYVTALQQLFAMRA